MSGGWVARQRTHFMFPFNHKLMCRFAAGIVRVAPVASTANIEQAVAPVILALNPTGDHDRSMAVLTLKVPDENKRKVELVPFRRFHQRRCCAHSSSLQGKILLL